MKIERLHAILLVLQKNEWTTAPDLAKIFNVTSRTIWRDVDELCRAGIPVLTKQGVKGGIALPSEFKQMYQEISIESSVHVLFFA
jgi:predicted DNA-binding transcriptional regulator YafY